MAVSKLFAVRREIPPKTRTIVMIMSFVLPLMIWSLVSYVPFIWHPKVEVTEPGDAGYFTKGMLVDRDVFNEEVSKLAGENKTVPEGHRANPVYLPAPHEVATAFYTAFTTEPKRRNENWLHESLWESIQVIFWGFFISSIIGVPLGILCGTYDFFSKLFEPFVEFFRYLPAPAFGALAVAILGIHSAPKIAIIFIGTFFQQVLVVSNTTRKLDPSLLEAALTLGARRLTLLFRVVVPGIINNLYKDLRILLGWAWTYLIVAELIGSSSGITWFITQQARYKNFDNVYAAIMMIGILGLTTDLILARLGYRLFPWEREMAKS
ncbi:MAG: ABC transporter permease subunit [Gammaproteobacteria bacterium]|jgi:NitT/TauT family transport system permease protein